MGSEGEGVSDWGSVKTRAFVQKKKKKKVNERKEIVIKITHKLIRLDQLIN